MSKRRYIQNLRSQTTIDNNGVKIPKLPEANYIKEGEIAINFATGYETIAIKNADGEIVKFDNKVDENYEQTHYTDRFDDLVDNNVVTNNDGDHLNTHIKGGDNIGFAFKKTEGTINKLVEEIYDNEEITAKSIGTLGIATGVINDKGIIGYQKENDSNYIAGAHNLHEATVLLDNSLNGVETTVNEHQNQITAVKATADQNKTDIATLNDQFFPFTGRVMNIARAAGVINDQNVIGYKKEKDTNYIANANSIHEATIALDSQIKNNENLINGVLNVLPDYDEKFDKIDKVISKFPSIEYVDLGLPSRTLWLTCNLGANRPTDIGHYYMWGSLRPNDKTVCNWKNTPFNDGQTTKNDTVFDTATTGSKNIVLYQDRLNEAFDVIYHRTHGIASLPTEKQINELISNTNTTMNWVTNYQGTTVNGFTFTSKKNNKVLFIPAGGYRDETSTKEIGKIMFVMSSNIDSNHDIITLRGYYSGSSGSLITMPMKDTLYRYRAIPLRGVIV